MIPNTINHNLKPNRNILYPIREIFGTVIVFVLLPLPLIVCEMFLEPVHRGFFCNDNAINYPYSIQTINGTVLLIGFILLPSVIILFGGEYVIQRHQGKLLNEKSRIGHLLLSWLINFIKHYLYFAFGLLAITDLMEICKFTIGRLRPHFMAVCQPQIVDGTTCRDPINQYRYVENYVCLGEGYEEANIREARVSFFSGHSALALYTATYLCIYLQKRFSWQQGHFRKQFLQFVLLMNAMYVALTRVKDHWHHPTDVLVGTVLGILTALLSAAYVAKFWQLEKNATQSISDSTTSLNEVCVIGKADKTTESQ